MTPHHRAAVLFVATATGMAALWLLLVAVPDLVDRHADGALAAALALGIAVPAGLVWGATRLATLLRDDDDDR